MKAHIPAILTVAALGTAACSGGSESTVADGGPRGGGGGDDYGVEIPVATSLALADFGYDPNMQLGDSVIKSEIQDLWRVKDGAFGNDSDIAYMTATSGTQVVAMIGPLVGESCADFMDALLTRTEKWLCERRTALTKSLFKTETGAAKLDLRFNRDDHRFNCTAVLAASALPNSKCYVGAGGTIAFATEVKPVDQPGGGTDDDKEFRLWSNQAGSFQSQSLFTCLSGDASCDPLNPRKTHALNWMWDVATEQFRFLIGHSSERRIFETAHTEWDYGQSNALSITSQTTVASSGYLSGVAMKKTGDDLDRLAFVQRGNNDPELYSKVGVESWSLRRSSELQTNYGAWKSQVAQDGTATWFDALGSSLHRPRTENLFTVRDTGSVRSAAFDPLNCSASTESTLLTAALQGGRGHFIAGCREMTTIDALGLYATVDIGGSSGSWSYLSDGVMAIAAHPQREPEVFYAWNHDYDPNYGPNPQNPAVGIARWTADGGLRNMDITGDVPRAGDPFQWNQNRIVAMRAIQDGAGRSYVAFVVGGSDLDKAMYLGTPFPDNTLHIERISDVVQASGQLSLSNMILYERQ